MGALLLLTEMTFLAMVNSYYSLLQNFLVASPNKFHTPLGIWPTGKWANKLGKQHSTAHLTHTFASPIPQAVVLKIYLFFKKFYLADF